MKKNIPTGIEDDVRRSVCTADSGIHLREDDGEGGGRTITGYAVRFDTPSAPLWSDDESEAREVIAAGAITAELLDACDIKFTMFHNRETLLGRSNRGKGNLRYFVDDTGVGFDLELPRTVDGDKALELIRCGVITGCSFAFSTRYRDAQFVERTVAKEGDRAVITYTVRAVTAVYDFTLAADPAYPSTSVEARELGELRRSLEGNAAGDADVRRQVSQMRSHAAAPLLR